MAPSASSKTRRDFLKTTGGVAAAAAIAGCSSGGGDGTTTGNDQAPEDSDGGDGTEPSGESDETTEKQIEKGGTLRLQNASASTLDPAAQVLTSEYEMIAQIFDPLVGKPHGYTTVKPKIAKDWEVSNGGKTYTFTLHENVVAHNGQEITAQDVVYSWERIAASENTTNDYLLLGDLGVAHETDSEGNYKPGSLAVTAVDDYTVEIELQKPYFAALNIMADTTFSVLPEGIVGDIDGYDGEMAYEDFKKDPVGTGAFELDFWKSDNEAAVKYFDDYYGEKPNIDRIHWQVIADANAQFSYAMNKNVDVFSVPTSRYDPDKISINKEDDIGRKIGSYGPLQNDEKADYVRIAGLSASFVLFNNNSVPKPVRQATAWVMNPHELGGEAYKGRLEPGYHQTPKTLFPGGPGEAEKHAKEKYPYGYNESSIGKAREIMEKAGYGDDSKFEFEMMNTSGATNKQVSQQLRDKLSAAHIDMKISTAPFSTLLDQEFQGKRDAGLGEWGMSWADPMNVLALIYPENTITTNNEGASGNPLVGLNWTGTEYSKKAREAWKTMQNHKRATDKDQQARAEAIKKLEEANWEDCAMIPYGAPAAERFSYSWVDMPLFGKVGSISEYDNVSVDTDKQPN